MHGGGDQQVLAGLQLTDQLLGEGEVLIRAIRLAHHRLGIARAQRRQRVAHQVAHRHLGFRVDTPGHFPRQLAAGRGLVVGAALEQEDAWHGGAPERLRKAGGNESAGWRILPGGWSVGPLRGPSRMNSLLQGWRFRAPKMKKPGARPGFFDRLTYQDDR
ncbi:hypothetical protein D9M68_870640 [compost metagenome]